MSRFVTKRLIIRALLLFLGMFAVYWILSLAPGNPSDTVLAKPVIMLYPQQPLEVEVKVGSPSGLTCVYPAYDDGWRVVAHPDGQLVDEKAGRYRCLFWEAQGGVDFDFTHGFAVKGEDTAQFLEGILEEIGLNSDERNDFIIYWLPQMQENPYNIISFQQEEYTDAYPLEIRPTPDSLLRVFMAWKPSPQYVELVPQTFEGFERQGFTVVEWGGAQVK